jgi:hypothetical protein
MKQFEKENQVYEFCNDQNLELVIFEGIVYDIS